MFHCKDLSTDNETLRGLEYPQCFIAGSLCYPMAQIWWFPIQRWLYNSFYHKYEDRILYKYIVSPDPSKCITICQYICLKNNDFWLYGHVENWQFLFYSYYLISISESNLSPFLYFIEWQISVYVCCIEQLSVCLAGVLDNLACRCQYG